MKLPLENPRKKVRKLLEDANQFVDWGV